jgi:hypothetical protein
VGRHSGVNPKVNPFVKTINKTFPSMPDILFFVSDFTKGFTPECRPTPYMLRTCIVCLIISHHIRAEPPNPSKFWGGAHHKFITSLGRSPSQVHHKFITSLGRSPGGPDGQDRLPCLVLVQILRHQRHVPVMTIEL